MPEPMYTGRFSKLRGEEAINAMDKLISGLASKVETLKSKSYSAELAEIKQALEECKLDTGDMLGLPAYIFIDYQESDYTPTNEPRDQFLVAVGEYFVKNAQQIDDEMLGHLAHRAQFHTAVAKKITKDPKALDKMIAKDQAAPLSFVAVVNPDYFTEEHMKDLALSPKMQPVGLKVVEGMVALQQSREYKQQFLTPLHVGGVVGVLEGYGVNRFVQNLPPKDAAKLGAFRNALHVDVDRANEDVLSQIENINHFRSGADDQADLDRESQEL